MGCHTTIYKKVTTVQDCIRLIEAALKNANDTIELYNDNIDNIFGEETAAERAKNWASFMDDVKKGNLLYDPDDAFCYMMNGKWVYWFDLTYDDVLTECLTIIARCQSMLTFPLLKSFEELKSFIVENSRFWGVEFEEHRTLENYNQSESMYSEVVVYNDEIYVNSDEIQQAAFSNCKYFRVYGYPCEFVYGCPWYYQSSPAGEEVYGWTNADELIEFLEWYKTADERNPQYDSDNELIVNDLPTVDGNAVGYGEELYSAIREFFEVNKDKNLLVNFS